MISTRPSAYVGGPLVEWVLTPHDMRYLSTRHYDPHIEPTDQTWAVIGVDDEDELAALEFLYLSTRNQLQSQDASARSIAASLDER